MAPIQPIAPTSHIQPTLPLPITAIIPQIAPLIKILGDLPNLKYGLGFWVLGLGVFRVLGLGFLGF
jgi:hypothetical protein